MGTLIHFISSPIKIEFLLLSRFENVPIDINSVPPVNRFGLVRIYVVGKKKTKRFHKIITD